MTKEDGIKLREARRARVRRIRARVIGGSVALFLAMWMLITVVLVTGHDPALARKTLTQVATTATTTTPTATAAGSTSSGDSSGTASSSSSTGSTSSGSTSSGTTSSSTGSGSSGVSGVTSSQS
jgi:outer membrane biosynthesis protein TonB